MLRVSMLSAALLLLGDRVFAAESKTQGSLQVAWREPKATPYIAAANGIIYEDATSVGLARAVEVLTGREKWRVNVPRGNSSFDGPILAGDTVLMSLGFGVVARATDTGSERWRFLERALHVAADERLAIVGSDQSLV